MHACNDWFRARALWPQCAKLCKLNYEENLLWHDGRMQAWWGSWGDGESLLRVVVVVVLLHVFKEGRAELCKV